MKYKKFILLLLLKIPQPLLAETLDDVLSEAGVHSEDLEALKISIGITDPVKIRNRIQWLKDHHIEPVGKFVTSFPEILGLQIANLEFKVNWLKRQGVTNVPRFLKTSPSVLKLNIVDNLDPKIYWLKSLGVEDVGKTLSRFPALLNYDLENNLKPKVEWLKKLGVTKLGKVLSNYPAVFGSSVEKNLKYKVAWLKEQGVTNIGKVITLFPSFWSLDVEDNLNPKIRWLKEEGFTNIAAMITSFPAFLSYSVEDNLAPTLEILFKSFGIDRSEVEARPMLLGASIQRLRDLDEWLKLAEIDVQKIPLKKRKAIAQNLSREDVFSHLMRFYIFLKRRVHPNKLSKVIENVIPAFQEAGIIHRILVPKNLMSRRAAEDCAAILEGLIQK